MLAVLVGTSGCAAPVPATPAGTSAAAPTGAAAITPAASAGASPSPSPSGSPAPAATAGGFGFAVEAIVGYYQSIGYTCTSGQPSPRAPGFSVRTCSLVDGAGRTHEIEVVTDASGQLAAAIATITGMNGESVLDPSAVLEPMAAFAGALLGADPGAALVPWLAAHLGDAHSETTSGSILVETYLGAPDVHSAINLGLSAPDYLQAVATAAP